MTFTDFAIHMHPYWIFGGLMIWAVSKSSFKELLQINKKSLLKWTAFMAVVSVYRYFTLKLALSHGFNINLEPIRQLPLLGTMTVFWEDACHGLPLVILNRCLGSSKWFLPVKAIALLLVMLSFASGHLYQGLLPAMLLSLYIPFSVKFIKDKGAGTIMIGHMLYDFSTLLIVKLLIGF
jgi:hypothetical protein